MSRNFNNALHGLKNTFPTPNPKREEEFLQSLPELRQKEKRTILPMLHMGKKSFWYAVPAIVTAALVMTVGIKTYQEFDQSKFPMDVISPTVATTETIATTLETFSKETDNIESSQIIDYQDEMEVPTEENLPAPTEISPTGEGTASESKKILQSSIEPASTERGSTVGAVHTTAPNQNRSTTKERINTTAVKGNSIINASTTARIVHETTVPKSQHSTQITVPSTMDVISVDESTTKQPIATTKATATTKQPIATTKPPATTKQSVATTKATATTKKTVATTKPPATTKQTVATTKATATTKQPVATTKPPATTKQTVATTKATATTKQPIATTKATATTKQPVATTKATATTKQPIATTKATATTKQPVATTKATATTKQPIATTKPPAATTVVELTEPPTDAVETYEEPTEMPTDSPTEATELPTESPTDNTGENGEMPSEEATTPVEPPVEWWLTDYYTPCDTIVNPEVQPNALAETESLEALKLLSSDILTAEVLNVKYFFGYGDMTNPYTEVTLKVMTPIKGDCQKGEIITLYEYGGYIPLGAYLNYYSRSETEFEEYKDMQSEVSVDMRQPYASEVGDRYLYFLNNRNFLKINSLWYVASNADKFSISDSSHDVYVSVDGRIKITLEDLTG